MNPIRLALLALVVGALAGAPGPAQGAAVRFAVIGDYGSAGESAEAVAALVTSWAPDFIVTTGDNNYPSGAASTIDANIGQYYHAFIDPYHGQYGPGATVNRFFPTLGNHDWQTSGARPYLDYFTLPGLQRYYEVRWGPVHLFIVDSDGREPDGNRADSVQAAWLRDALASSSAPWKLVALHHPPQSSGPHGSSENLQWPFAEWGADAVLAGHDHLYERVTLDDFPYFVNGLGGAARYLFRPSVPGSQVRFNAEHGAMLLEADDDSITFQFFTKSGALIDTYALYASPSSHPSAAPGGLVADAVSDSEVDLAWVDNASNETEVIVEVSSDGEAFVPAATLTSNVTEHTVATLEAGTTYHFRVTARNTAGASAPSSPAIATTESAGPPPAPMTLIARPLTATSIELAWVDTADNERGIVVEQSAGAAFAPVANLDRNATRFTSSGLDGGIAYQFRVRAHNPNGPSAWSNVATSMTARPDLQVTALGGVPGIARPGDKMTLSIRTTNEGDVAAPASSVTRFYLVPNEAGTRLLLEGGAPVGPLAPGDESLSQGGVSIPKTATPGRYDVEACADDKQALVEHNEANNCQAAGPLQVSRPDLVTESITDPPARVRRGERFTVTDIVRNAGTAPAAKSATRYYLTSTGSVGSGAWPLKGRRSVPALDPGATSTGGVKPSVPSSMPLGTYRLVVCADGFNNVSEESETNNCATSPSSVVIDP